VTLNEGASGLYKAQICDSILFLADRETQTGTINVKDSIKANPPPNNLINLVFLVLGMPYALLSRGSGTPEIECVRILEMNSVKVTKTNFSSKSCAKSYMN
jgi:hypothetical protein